VVDVVATDEFKRWYDDLDEQDTTSVMRVVDLLEARGLSLGFPHSSAIKGSRHALRELRVQSGGKAIRVFYAFDPKRQAVVIVGGDKTGLGDRFYEQMVPVAEKVWEDYLASQ
jgi:hypothetical protein